MQVKVRARRSSSRGALQPQRVTFADFLSSDYRFEQLVELVQLFLLVGLFSGLVCLGLSRLNTQTGNDSMRPFHETPLQMV